MNFWCGEQLIVTVEGPEGRSVVSLEQPFARVGRHPESDVVLDDPSAAIRSLYLHATPRGVYCLFLDVHASDVPAVDVAARGIWLRPDQEITVGSHRVRASLLTAEPDDPLPDDNPATWGSAPRPLPVVNVYYGDLLKDKRRFRAVLSPIGRRPQCGLQLKAKRVSSFHCVLFWYEQRLWCVDLNSSNGTQLNGESIVCSQVAIGDKLDVGEFSLVFERLSYGRSLPPAEASSSNASVPSAEFQPADPHQTAPSSELPAAPSEADSEPLRQQLADEIARLAAERATIEERWEQASRQLQSEVARLHDEAARLAAERAAFDQSRSHWSDDRDALNRQLAQRSEQLACLQDELSQATESLTQKLAAAEQSIAPIPEEVSPSPPDAATLAALAPATLIAALDDELVPPPEPEVVWNYVAADPAADVPPPIDPAEELRSRLEAQWQAQWQEKNRQLTVQIQQLRAEAAELAAERQSLGQSRQAWQAEHEALAHSLGARQEQIDRQQAEISAAAAALAARLAASDETLRSAPAQPLPEQPEPPAATPPAEPNLEPNLEPIVEWNDSISPEPVGPSDSPAKEPELADSEPVFEADDEEADDEIDLDALDESMATAEEPSEPPSFSLAEPAEQASPQAGRLADRDELTLFVSNRLVHRESEKRRPRLVWWIVAGAGAIAIVATVAVVIWRMF